MNKLDIITKKVLNDLELDRMAAYWKFKGKKVVALYGTFDILHPSVFDLITYAAEFGQELVVGVKGDDEIQTMKGEKFPVFNQDKRALTMASNLLVSAVYICKSTGPKEFLQKVKPAYAVCCSHSSEEDQKALEIVKEWKGKVNIFTGSTTSPDDIISRFK